MPATVEVGDPGGVEERTGEGEVLSEGVAVAAERGSGVGPHSVGETSTAGSRVGIKVGAGVAARLLQPESNSRPIRATARVTPPIFCITSHSSVTPIIAQLCRAICRPVL